RVPASCRGLRFEPWCSPLSSRKTIGDTRKNDGRAERVGVVPFIFKSGGSRAGVAPRSAGTSQRGQVASSRKKDYEAIRSSQIDADAVAMQHLAAVLGCELCRGAS